MKLMLEIDPNHVDAELLTRIGSELECGGTFRQDPLMAVRAYDAAAACPDGGQAANNLGWMFLKGKGVAQDTEKALALFRNAAERGNSIAMVNLGNYYEFAEKQDDKHAVYWYRKAADSGDEKGCSITPICCTMVEGSVKTAKRRFPFSRISMRVDTTVQLFTWDSIIRMATL